jgi:hypothetical protein
MPNQKRGQQARGSPIRLSARRVIGVRPQS